jgi:hypothetical protein
LIYVSRVRRYDERGPGGISGAGVVEPVTPIVPGIDGWKLQKNLATRRSPSPVGRHDRRFAGRDGLVRVEQGFPQRAMP